MSVRVPSVLSCIACVVCLSVTAAGAEETAKTAFAAAPQTQMPAVDGVNAVFETVGGSVSKESLYGAGGLVAMPLSGPYGLEIGGAGGSFDGRGFGTAGLNLFWRDPAQGRLGLVSDFSYFDTPIGGLNAYSVGGEAEHYFGPITLSAMAGVFGHASLSGSYNSLLVNVSSKSGFFDEATLAYYPQDNLRLSIGHAYSNSINYLTLGGEWGFPVGGGTTMTALFVDASLSSRTTAVIGGLRIYFGQKQKTLIKRNREDDSSDPFFHEFLDGINRDWEPDIDYSSGCGAGCGPGGS